MEATQSQMRQERHTGHSHTRPSSSYGCAEAEGTAVDGMWQRAAVVTSLGQPHATPSRTAAVESDATDAIPPIHAASSVI
ncbi:hypothetical protein M422DRAFT_259736 [Sphaerobolus stellatus SS14]|uniref:Uncharacterized protein n=1 Tax=Sphaerobolus stellatus (strain SS14) TaxID=990650 RepID=A0A0C9VJ60_SPHS4|nr:hypothetical protein M422DRAFT_259736 [Sphaerobolus stellatus SS14]